MRRAAAETPSTASYGKQLRGRNSVLCSETCRKQAGRQR
jgi:hypothetical protein